MNKYKFAVEIVLSDKQLQAISEMAGLEDGSVQDLKAMQHHNNPNGVITSDPNHDLGFGADINDIFSLGCLLLNHLNEANTKMTFADLRLHPYRLAHPVIENIVFHYDKLKNNL
jgi:hypothetical protein